MEIISILLGVNIIILILLKFWVIPEYISKNNQDDMQSIVTFACSAVSLILNFSSNNFNYKNLIYISLFLFIIALDIGGIYWWIPTYVPKDQQADTKHYLILATSILVILSTFYESTLLSSASSTYNIISGAHNMSAGRRR
jgi:hypothetical protein